MSHLGKCILFIAMMVVASCNANKASADKNSGAVPAPFYVSDVNVGTYFKGGSVYLFVDLNVNKTMEIDCYYELRVWTRNCSDLDWNLTTTRDVWVDKFTPNKLYMEGTEIVVPDLGANQILTKVTVAIRAYEDYAWIGATHSYNPFTRVYIYDETGMVDIN
jgi:hypothetical protein